MSYDIYLFRKEVKEQNEGLEFLEDESLFIKFTEEQFEYLKKRLINYGFQILHEQADSIQYNFKGEELGILALLTEAQLSFSSVLSSDAVFEISMTASEFTDTGEFAVLNPQEGTWEVMDE